MVRLTVKLVIISCLLITLSACIQTTPKKLNVSLEQLAEKSFNKKNYESARAYYEQAVQNRPTISAYIGLAETLEAMKDWASASSVWYGLTKLNDLDIHAKSTYLIKASKNSLRSGNALKAKELLISLDVTYKKKREAQSIAGLIAVLEGDKKSAIQHFKNILSQTPDDDAAKSNLGLTYLVFNQIDKALEYLKPNTTSTSSPINYAIALVFQREEDLALTTAKSVQSNEDALATIQFARKLLSMSPQLRAKSLFGIGSRN